MSKHDPRRKAFFDTPGNTDNELSDAVVPEQPRRKRRKRRDSLAGSARVAEDGFVYKKKKRNRRPTSIKKRSKPAEPISKATKQVVERREEEILAPLPEYPDTSKWSIAPDWAPDTTPPVALMKLIKQTMSNELQHARTVYAANHQFVLDRLENISTNFLSQLHSSLIEEIAQSGALEPPVPLPNAQNELLREQRLVWSDVVKRLEDEVDQWKQLPDRPLQTASDCRERAQRALDEYCEEQAVENLVTHSVPKSTDAISSKVLRMSILNIESSNMMAKLSDSIEVSRAQQDLVTRSAVHASLQPFQKITDARGLITGMLTRV